MGDIEKNYLDKRRATKGFKKTSAFLNQLTQRSFEKKGFAQYKLLTNWKEIIGLELWEVSKPAKITFPKSKLGGTLTVEIDGAYGPELEMQKNIIKEKVNRIYGYTAVTKVKFQISSSLGYQRSEVGKVSFGNPNKDSPNENFMCKNESRSALKKNTEDLILKLEGIDNQELRQCLKKFSGNFVKSLK